MSRREALALAFLFACGEARADTVDGSITTLLAGHSDPRDGKVYTVVPAYEMVSLVGQLRAPHLDDVRVVLSGWGMVAFGDPRDGKVATGDLDLGYLEASALGHVRLRVGRMLMVGGAARVTQLDGASVDWRIARGVGLTVYGGAPVTPRFGTSRGDAVGGGRLFYRHSTDTELGLSFIHLEGQGRIARQDLALDARYAPLQSLTLTGYASLSTYALRLDEATLAASWAPIRQLQVAAEWRRTAPDLFLPLNSVFSVFAQETRDEAGATVFAQPWRRLKLYGDYHLVLDDTGTGHKGGLRAQLALGQQPHATVGVELRTLQLPTQGYWQARLYGMERWGAFLVTADLDSYRLDNPINGQNFSFTAAGSVGWDFADGWRTVVTGIADVTPFVEHRFELLAKLIYNYSFHFREVTP